MLPFTNGKFRGIDVLASAKLLGAAYSGESSAATALARLNLYYDWEIQSYRKPDSSYLGHMVLRHRIERETMAIFLPGMSNATHCATTLAGWNTPIGFDDVGIGNPFFQETAKQLVEQPANRWNWKGKTVLVVGHSAGGAAAEFLFNSKRFRDDTFDAQIVTFGAPKPFLVLQSGSISERPGYRIFNEDDPVPLMPGQGVREITTAGVFGWLNGSTNSTWCHCRNGIALTPYGKWDRGLLPLYSVDDADALSRLLPVYGVGLFPNHSIAEYIRRLQLVADAPPLELGMFIERPPENDRQLRVGPVLERRVITAVVQVQRGVDADRRAAPVVHAKIWPTLRMKRVRSRTGPASIRWMQRHVGTSSTDHAFGFVRMHNRTLYRMVKAGVWNKKNTVDAYSAFLDAVSGGVPGASSPEMVAS